MSMNIKEMKDAVIKVLETVRSVKLIEMWNERCENWKYMEDYIDHNDIDELLYGCSPSEVLNRIDTENYNMNDDYVVDTQYGYRSFDFADDDNSPIELSDLAEYIVMEEEYFGIDELAELFEDDEEEE